jgi:hypothetical protein
MLIAKQKGLKSIALLPLVVVFMVTSAEEAVKIALGEVIDAIHDNEILEDVTFCCFDDHMVKLYQSACHISS